MAKRKKIAGGVLAEGEVTGHAHRVGVAVYETEIGTREFDGATTVTHEEHGPITLPDRKWASGRVREMDHYAEQAREVMD